MARISEKYNDAVLKVFALLSLLAKGEADFSEVIGIFANADGKLTKNSNVLLNKYLNTVKVFGVEVKKVKNKYILNHMPFSMKLDEKDLKAVAMIRSALSFLPEGKNKANIESLLKDMENLYDGDTRKLNSVIALNKNYDLSFYFTKFEKQITECEDYLQKSSKLEILYSDEDKDCNIMCIPQEIKYQDNLVYYSVYNTLNRQIYDIPVGSINNIQKISDNASKEQSCTSVIFKLKGNLAKRYKLRDWEHSPGFDENGSLIVVNEGEDFKVLSRRLLRYDEMCEVIAPEYFKNGLIKTIGDMLTNYGQ